MRRLLVTTASVIALGLGGIGFANANTMKQPNLSGSSTPPTASTTQSQEKATGITSQRAKRTVSHKLTATKMSRSEVIQAQRKLHAEGLYRGRIDGRLNSGTKIALRRFQQQNHLPMTARLDNRTMGSLMGGGMGQGSSRPPKSTHARAMGHNKLQQNVNQPGNQPSNTNTMGQGSSGNNEPNATQMTPPNQPTPSGDTSGQTQNTGTGHNNYK